MKTIMKRHCRLKNIKSNTKKKKPTNTLHNSNNELFTAIYARAFVFHPGTAVGVLACIILRQVRTTVGISSSYRAAPPTSAPGGVGGAAGGGGFVPGPGGGQAGAVRGVTGQGVSQETTFLYIPNSAVGAIIGTKGSHIRNIIKFSGSSVKISSAEEGEEGAEGDVEEEAGEGGEGGAPVSPPAAPP